MIVLSLSHVTVLMQSSGASIATAQIVAIKKQLLPSVRSASNYFETERVSLREVFQKTGKQSLRELVHLG